MQSPSSDDAADAAAGIEAFEGVWHTLPPLADAAAPAAASVLYARRGHAGPARLMAGLAAQLGGPAPLLPESPVPESLVPESLVPESPVPASPAEPEALARHAATIAAGHAPGAALLHALEGLANSADWAGSAALFESVWRRAPPMPEYWVYHRMAQVYADLGRPQEAALVAGIAVQMEPGHAVSDAPHRHILAWLQSNRRVRDAALLCRRRARLCPDPPLLPAAERDALFAAAGPLLPEPPQAARRDIALAASEPRPAGTWPAYGGVPTSLRALHDAMERPPLHVTELHGAEVLLDQGAVAVFGADGVAQVDLSVRDTPALVRRRLDAARGSGAAVEELTLDAAVLIADEFPGPNLCHFMLDQASRLVLYRNAGVDIAAVTVIGPELRHPFQRIVAARAGVRAYVSSLRRARLQVGRLWVSSNCRDLRHPAHWGAPWALGAVRDLFDTAPRARTRRLLISRADSPVRRIANEAAVQQALAPFGFETIVPGRMAFEDQIAAFRDATHIVGPHGAGLANILFCAPGTRVLEVFHPLYGTWAYAMIAPTLGLDYASMLGRDGDSDDPVYNDPALPQERRNQYSDRHMRVNLDDLRRWLRESGASEVAA